MSMHLISIKQLDLHKKAVRPYQNKVTSSLFAIQRPVNEQKTVKSSINLEKKHSSKQPGIYDNYSVFSDDY